MDKLDASTAFAWIEEGHFVRRFTPTYSTIISFLIASAGFSLGRVSLRHQIVRHLEIPRSTSIRLLSFVHKGTAWGGHNIRWYKSQWSAPLFIKDVKPMERNRREVGGSKVAGAEAGGKRADVWQVLGRWVKVIISLRTEKWKFAWDQGARREGLRKQNTNGWSKGII